MKFAPEAWPFVLPFVALAAILGFLGAWPWAGLALFLGLLVLLFFRDPQRGYEGPEDDLVAPADGLVLEVSTGPAPEVGEGTFHRVITFLSVFDVHVQRCPTGGEVIHSQLISGRKLAAFKAGLEEVNERHLTVIRRPGGDSIGILQIVGLLARRIVCRLEPGQQVQRGDSLGLIKFGSRVDLLVPDHYHVEVRKGDRLRNGETRVARRGGAKAGAA
jgi:phosphatidylserine decarboxylase